MALEVVDVAPSTATKTVPEPTVGANTHVGTAAVIVEWTASHQIRAPLSPSDLDARLPHDCQEIWLAFIGHLHLQHTPLL
jgi:hypothetical protein